MNKKIEDVIFAAGQAESMAYAFEALYLHRFATDAGGSEEADRAVYLFSALYESVKEIRDSLEDIAATLAQR